MAARVPSSRTATLSTSGLLPVAQDTSGQSVSTPQASNPRVMESPTAATEAGLRSHTTAGAASARCRPRPASSGASPPTASQPASPSTAAVSTATAVRTRCPVFRIARRPPRSLSLAPSIQRAKVPGRALWDGSRPYKRPPG
ncbi:hypothetical protein GCM10020295_58340 [Streptomyces cinereospinus]